MNQKTLIIGIQDLDSIPYGATLRVMQHAKTIPNVTYVNVGNRINWHKRSAIGKMLQAIRFLRPWREPFVAYHYSAAKWNQLESLIIQERFARIIFTEIWTYRYLSAALAHCKDVELILDLHNVESKLQELLNTNLYEGWRTILMRHMERKFIVKVDTVWTCSDVDARELHRLYDCEVKVVSNAVLVPLDFVERTANKTIGFVGTFNYPPNEEAAMLLLSEIQPRLGCDLHLIGKNPTERMKAWKNPRVTITGEVLSVTDALRNVRTIVIPLRSGSGTRLKVLEAMAHGIPIVATAKAVEGLNVQPGIHYLNAETPEDFALCIKALWDSPKNEQLIAENARKLVQEKYAWTS